MAGRSKGPIIRPSEPEEEARAYSSPACYLHEFDSNVEPARACDVRIKRVFEVPSSADGYRVLVDRLWPRGITTARARLDAWLRTLAPSPELRKWFGHDPARFAEFRRRYRQELLAHAAEIDALRLRSARQRVTLVYAARDSRVNHAAVLEEAIRDSVDGHPG
jgi:uncharacterized protein YeaO (DUF488 family)